MQMLGQRYSISKSLLPSQTKQGVRFSGSSFIVGQRRHPKSSPSNTLFTAESPLIQDERPNGNIPVCPAVIYWSSKRPHIAAALDDIKEHPVNESEASSISRRQLIDLLNEDLSREYLAIIAYVNYSQVLKGAQYMNIAAELEIHAGEELAHALTIAKQIDYLGAMPSVTPLSVKTSEKAE
jgi:hypothetical protein